MARWTRTPGRRPGSPAVLQWPGCVAVARSHDSESDSEAGQQHPPAGQGIRRVPRIVRFGFVKVVGNLGHEFPTAERTADLQSDLKDFEHATVTGIDALKLIPSLPGHAEAEITDGGVKALRQIPVFVWRQ